MPNIFLLYMPPGNAEAMIHYEQTNASFSVTATLRRDRLDVPTASDSAQAPADRAPLEENSPRFLESNRYVTTERNLRNSALVGR